MASNGVQFGRYELVKRIARGGMAEIFLAIERGIEGVEREVVVKRVLPQMMESEDFVTMFMDEARLASRLTHPNIAHVYEFGEVEGVYYLAMEYVDGLTASRLVRLMRKEKVPTPVTLRIIADACAGLHYAHEVKDQSGRPLGVVHRDVSPQNIIVSCSGAAKLLDFGVASAATQAHITQAGQLKGKLAYMSPEQFRGSAIDRRADVFAAGAVLYEMVTGERLFLRENEAATMHALMYDEPPSVTKFGGPPALDDIIGTACQKQSKDRYASAFEMQNAIEELIAGSGMIVTPFQLGRFITKGVEAVNQAQARADKQSAMDASVPDLTPSHISLAKAPRMSSVPSAPTPTPGPTPSEPPTIAETLKAKGASPTPAHVTPSPASDVAQPGGMGGLHKGIIAVLVLVLLVVLGGGGYIAWYLSTLGNTGDRQAATASGGQRGDLGAIDDLNPPPTAPPNLPVPIPPEPVVPATIPDAAAASPDAAAPQADAAASGTKQPEKNRPRQYGTLFLNTTPWAKVRVAGRNLGNTPIVGKRLPAGNHSVTLTDPNGNRHRRRVKIRPNEATKMFINLRTGPNL